MPFFISYHVHMRHRTTAPAPIVHQAQKSVNMTTWMLWISIPILAGFHWILGSAIHPIHVLNRSLMANPSRSGMFIDCTNINLSSVTVQQLGSWISELDLSQKIPPWKVLSASVRALRSRKRYQRSCWRPSGSCHPYLQSPCFVWCFTLIGFQYETLIPRMLLTSLNRW